MSPADHVQTDRLVLHRPAPGDLDDLACLRRNPVAMASIGAGWPFEDSQAYLDTMMTHWVRHGFGWWIAREPSGTMVGYAGLRHFEFEGRAEIELGYALAPEYWGRGLGTELALACITDGRGRMPLDSVVAITLPTNRTSQRVMEKAGLRYERDIMLDGQPHVLYRLTFTPKA
jgi:RimJ/RimL family protein N-acetyltransferase